MPLAFRRRWMTPVDAEVIERAIQYPYEIPRRSYIFDADAGDALPYRSAVDDVTRTAVLAIGSNAAPEQLRRKFPVGHRWGRVPVLLAELRDFDIVYAARVSSYGAIPATLAPSPGTVATLHVTLLTGAQLERMDSTESVPAAYERVSIPSHLVRCHEIGETSTVFSYSAANGPLLAGTQPIALAATSASNRRFEALTEGEVLDRVAQHLGLSGREQLILAVTRDEGLRARVNRELSGLPPT